MSIKVCTESVRADWRDAVTIGQLSSMLDALISMGCLESTPVTYIYDEDHVWLETVADLKDD